MLQIAGIECESYAREMFAAGSDLQARTPEEIFYQDFKQFEFGDWNIGIGQITSMSSEELGHIKQRLMPYMEQVFAKHDADMVFFMLTDILSESSERSAMARGRLSSFRRHLDRRLCRTARFCRVSYPERSSLCHPLWLRSIA